MTKKEFLELADKFEQGKCSDKEKAVLFKFCEQAQFKSQTAHWDLSEESQMRVKLLKKILQTINTESQKSKAKIRFRHVRNIAAILIGIGLGCYFYFQQYNVSQTKIPSNSITLELEDGTIKIVKENDSSTFFNRQGGVLGKQLGNRLVYNDDDDDDERLEKLIYNTLTVPYGKRFELELSDGTIAHLNSGTSIKYPVKFLKDSERQIFVTGEAFLTVAKDSIHPFIARANNLNIKVLGTEFNINAYPEDTTAEVVLVEGSVALYDTNNLHHNDNKTLLIPGHKAIFNKDDYTISTKTVITDVYTSWINGELVFRNMPFENIIKKLERHYNIKIINKNTNINKTIFNASFGNETIDVILQSLKDNYGINYSINEKTITIN
ncbi:hypothetical protein APS56_06250 [Pseudalgibacter alginicilyticus]|uniref:Iron dicitrate transport regulator FecR n=1 Tax=Pseudalgibacter alginicilyticus TaxID=1736674 RepID=A0A0P0CW92_9FLAO|nr:FecR family protein [Pseudalgibacter alginicilyticus]ALJ04751.1 hypothetical protein APS56_06250 [Pseudalgibacter alginicilyticus]